MNNAFFDALCELASADKNIEFIKADVGFNAKFQQELFSNRTLNIGIAEQNMIAVATGMALEGKTVFAFSLVDFPTVRALDQIRMNLGYYRANVKIVSSGTGFDMCYEGVSHLAIEDIAIVRTISNILIFSPCDPYEAAAVTKAAATTNQPCYIRIGRGGEPNLHHTPIKNYVIGDVLTLRDGHDIVILSTGSISSVALEVAEALSDLEVGVYSFPTIRPLNREFVLNMLDTARIVVTVEEHSLVGGFGSAVAELYTDTGSHKAKLKRIGVPYDFFNDPILHSKEVRSKMFRELTPKQSMRKCAKLTTYDIIETIRSAI